MYKFAVFAWLGWGFLLAGCAQQATSSQQQGAPAGETLVETAPEQGALAPDFETQDLAGNRFSLRDQRGKVVVLNFWATWCVPCREEMPLFQEWHARYSPDLAILAVNFDEPPDLVKDFIRELGVTFPVLLDPGAEIQYLSRVRGYPTSLFVDRDGIIHTIHIGAVTDAQLEGYLRQAGLFE